MIIYQCQIITPLAFVIELCLEVQNFLTMLNGCAIDINPLYNPYVTKSSTTPPNGAIYANRSIENKYKIDKNDAIYKIFIKHRLVLGWKLVIF